MNLGYLFRNYSSSCFTKKLQGYQMLYSTILGTTPTPTPTTPRSSYTSTRKPVTVYLIERLGLSEEDSLSISKKLLRLRKHPRVNQVTDLINFEKSDYVITYLREYCGLDVSQVNKLITKCPTILGVNLDKTLKPKVQLLQDLGFSTSDLAHVLSAKPALYLHCDLSPTIQALRGILGSDEHVVKVFKGLNFLCATQMNYLVPNVDMLENEYGIPRHKLRKFLTSTPNALMWRTDWLRDVLVRIENNWGISRDSTVFLTAVSMFGRFSDENIESKCQVFRSFGWSESDIKSFIRQHPTRIRHSVTKTKKALAFYMNELGFEPAYMAARPALFSYSLENRVLPRHKVLSILKEKGLINADYQLYSALVLPEDKFFEKFVQPFVNDVPKLREVYQRLNTQ